MIRLVIVTVSRNTACVAQHIVSVKQLSFCCLEL